MRPVSPRRGLSVAALAVAAVLAGCASNNAEAEAEAEAARIAAEIAARQPPPIALNDSVAQAAAVYLTFTREMATLEGGFESPEAIQTALRRGAAYDPEQISRGLVAYASILALQSPEFVSGIRQHAGDRAVRDRMIAAIVADPAYASTLPGAAAAAGLVMTTLSADIRALSDAANSIENDAYAIQARHDPRRAWAVAAVADREGRLENAKVRSGMSMLPSASESARLFEAAHQGSGLGVSGGPRPGPYPAAVENALALAALAALGAAGENARPNTDALTFERVSQGCLSMSKLNLFQCLAASRPNYEDMFCVGRHVVRDLATCSRGAAMPAPRVTVSGLSVADEPEPEPIIITPTPAPTPPPAPVLTPAPASPPPVRSTPAPAPASATERLNRQPTGPGGR